MKVGCFALIDPFSTLDHQLQRIEDMGFKYADVTDSHPGSSLGRDYGFAATASLDENPMDLKRLFEKHGLDNYDGLCPRDLARSGFALPFWHARDFESHHAGSGHGCGACRDHRGTPTNRLGQ